MKVLDIAMVMILIVIIILFLIVARDILIPMVMAVFIWYLINVMAVTIRRIKIFGVQIPSFVSYMVSITGMLALLFFVTVLITSNISQVVKAIPVYENNFQRVTAHLMQFLHIEKTLDLKSMFRDIDISHIATQTASALTGLVSKTGLIILYIFFLFLEQKFFPRKLRAMVHEQKKFQDMLEMIEMIDRDIRTYIGIKTLVSLLTAILGYLIMASVGLDFAGFWAFLLFLLNFIPTLGSLLATILPSLLALVQFETLTPFLIVLGGIQTVQLVVANLIEPRLMGESLNLSPLVIILSLVLWGTLWGIPGMFFCVPLTVIFLIILSHFQKTRPVAVMLTKEGKLKYGEK